MYIKLKYDKLMIFFIILQYIGKFVHWTPPNIQVQQGSEWAYMSIDTAYTQSNERIWLVCIGIS